MNLLSLGRSPIQSYLAELIRRPEDGGGIRGLSSLLILQNIMEKIRFVEDLQTEPLPCEYFDMICGTSTGGYT
jgi:patatin-like phospholipase/acyl hydrolase